MKFQENNQFWKARSTHGRGLIFGSPDLLWEACKEYFEWCDNNPWYKVEQLKKPYTFKDENGKVNAVTTIEIPTERPYTIKGLCIFLDVDDELLDNYEKKADFSEVVSRIRRIIYTQKFEGASVGVFNPSIMIRELGLVDKSEITDPGQQIDLSTLSDDIIAAIIEAAKDHNGNASGGEM